MNNNMQDWYTQEYQKQVETFYEGKNSSILSRYGSGPRVHWHTGLTPKEEAAPTSPEKLRETIFTAQERMLNYIRDFWSVHSSLHSDILDVGCGLGGTSLFFAQEFGARVKAVTVSQSQYQSVLRLAEEAGLDSQIEPICSDVLELHDESCFDAAVALDSSCHIPRGPLFQKLAKALRPGGHIFLIDLLIGAKPCRKTTDFLNRHWCIRIGTLEEYLKAAKDAGLRQVCLDDLTVPSAQFWALTRRRIELEVEGKAETHVPGARLEDALKAHQEFQQGLLDGRFAYHFMSFAKQ